MQRAVRRHVESAEVPAVQYYVAQSLDGYIAELDGGIEWLTGFDSATEIGASEATDGSYDEFYAGVGAMAMGSATYEFILGLGAWPYGETPAWVFSSRDLASIEDADVRFARGPVGPVHADMIAAAGERNVWIVGGGGLAVQFADEGLLGELRLTIVPVVLGSGIPAFDGRLRSQLALAGTQVFSNGMVELRYGVAR